MQLLDTWISYVPAIVPAATSLGKLMVGARRPAQSAGINA
jgi:hypothetical protein